MLKLPNFKFFEPIRRETAKYLVRPLGHYSRNGALYNSRRCTRRNSTLSRVCIIGSGPAGFYTAQQLLKVDKNVVVDIYERSPVPFGLVRFGVAPDHPEVKNVINSFKIVAKNERCNFFGNVNVGVDVKTKELRDMYDAVVLAYGADKDKTLDIKGEDLDGVLSARAFVGWYNGMPAHANLNPDLSGQTAVIIGHGNVAIDVGRILLSQYDILQHTDICNYALDALKLSKVNNVYVAGRRGPLEASFTIKELREMINLPGCRTVFKKEDFEQLKEDIPSLPRQKKRIMELMFKTANQKPVLENTAYLNKFQPLFFRSPVEILSDEKSKVKGVKFEVNRLAALEDGSQKSIGTGQFEEINCSLVIRSIGYRSIRVDEGIPFDARMGFIPNKNGRVVKEAGSDEVLKGLYCSGWVKHGPVGVILTTMAEAKTTGNLIAEDINSNLLDGKGLTNSEVDSFLKSKNIEPLTYVDWERIDEEETKRGAELKKPREKIVSEKEMIEIASKTRSKNSKEDLKI